MSINARANVDESAVIHTARINVRAALGRIAARVQETAIHSMRPQTRIPAKSRRGAQKTTWQATPRGEPPRVRTGDLRDNIETAFDDELSIIIGPAALSGHPTDCLARLEQGDHPFMTPAFEKTFPQVPYLWGQSITQ